MNAFVTAPRLVPQLPSISFSIFFQGHFIQNSLSFSRFVSCSGDWVFTFCCSVLRTLLLYDFLFHTLESLHFYDFWTCINAGDFEFFTFPPCTGDFDFLQFFDLYWILQMFQFFSCSFCTGNFEFERKNCFEDFPLSYTGDFEFFHSLRAPGRNIYKN